MTEDMKAMIELVGVALKEVDSMSKADKMFEELGYVKSIWNHCDTYTWQDETKYVKTQIRFYEKQVRASHFIDGVQSLGSMALTPNITIALLEKMRELGWLNEQSI